MSEIHPKSGTASLSAVPMKLANSIPKYMDLETEREFSILHGNTDYSRIIHSTNNLSTANVNINCPPPSANTLIHPIAWKMATIELQFNVANASGVNYEAADANSSAVILRSHPLEKIIQTEE